MRSAPEFVILLCAPYARRSSALILAAIVTSGLHPKQPKERAASHAIALKDHEMIPSGLTFSFFPQCSISWRGV
jgi:hypothetical protein